MSFPDEEEDEAFLLAVAATEEAALASSDSSKRRRLSMTSSTSSSPTSATPAPAAVPEGPYLAALKGSHSSAWKQQQETLSQARKRPGGSQTLATPGSGSGGGGGGYGDAGGAVEEKACPCGAGSCLVLTSNTPRNPGRKFYRCPMRDNGGCNYFEWCDNPSPGPANVSSNTVFQSDTSVAHMLCPCGAGACLILTTKTGKNVGRQFYRCPANQGISYLFLNVRSGHISREVALAAISSGVMNNSLGQLLHCKLQHNIILMLLQVAKFPARGAPPPASNAGKRTIGQRTAQINLQILILTKVGEHLLLQALPMRVSSVVRAGTGPVIAPPQIVVLVPSPAMSSPLLLWAHGTATDTDSRYL
uniref:DNA topoisomerase n=1 Tax=Oryza barthii TaxID=65489 RepID=A0A0D3FPX8_9ORYZ